MLTVKLIVYGTLMTGECNHGCCRSAVSITPYTITGTLYDTGCGFPDFEPAGETVVRAEFIEIPRSDWEEINQLEEYPSLYDRRRMECTLADGSTDIGWGYIMNNLPAQAQVISSGDWKKYRRK